MDPGEVREEARARGGERKVAQGGLQLRRDRRSSSRRATRCPPAKLTPGMYRNIIGQPGASRSASSRRRSSPGSRCSSGRYPITPASATSCTSSSSYKNFGVVTFQAEDEIAAVGAALGAAYAGALGVTTTSGPGHRAEGRGHRPRGHDRAAARRRQRPARRPVAPAFRRRPSRPTCSRSLYGRNGESPMPVVAARRRATASTRPSRPCASRSST